jgi:PST family polysaccharide transporter
MHPDRILVGSAGGAATLGLYDSARRWAFYPVNELFMSLSDVALATFSRVSGDAARYRELLRRALLPVLAISLPVVAFVFVDAHDVVRILLGSQWDAAVPFVRWMSVAAFFGALARPTQWFYLSSGETGRQLRWAVFVQTPVMLASVLIGSRWGAGGIAAGFTAGTAVLAIPAVAWALRNSPFRFRDFVRVAARPVLASLVAAGTVGAVLLADPDPGFIAFAVRLGLFAVAYTATWMGLPGGRRDTAEILSVLRTLKTRTPRAAVSR